jgi:prepilin-type N-terminal cleavage/methylation domain-containing protein
MSRNDCGFTLLETLIATGLLVVIALGSAQLFTIAIARNLSAREQLAMSLLASTKVDDLAAAAAEGTIELSPSDSLDRVTAGWTDVSVHAGRTYVRRWRVSQVPGYADDLVALAVRVTPQAGTGDVRMATIRERVHP